MSAVIDRSEECRTSPDLWAISVRNLAINPVPEFGDADSGLETRWSALWHTLALLDLGFVVGVDETVSVIDNRADRDGGVRLTFEVVDRPLGFQILDTRVVCIGVPEIVDIELGNGLQRARARRHREVSPGHALARTRARTSAVLAPVPRVHFHRGARCATGQSDVGLDVGLEIYGWERETAVDLECNK